jgi:hypothetical protein
MPFTFSHPLAVVPLRRFCPERLNFAALIIGSMSPDFGYYVHQFAIASFAHTVVGTLAICLPSGLLAVGLFHVLRRPLCLMLPQPHRAALMPLTVSRPTFFSCSGIVTGAVSVLFGAWTHTIWDSFTHSSGWAVERFALLRAPLVSVGNATLPVSYILQQTSTVGAGAVLALLYFRWLRRQPTSAAAEADSLSDRWRYLLFILLAAIAIAIAVPSALRMASLFEGDLAFRVFVFRTGVYATAAFIPLFILCSIGVYIVHRTRT